MNLISLWKHLNTHFFKLNSVLFNNLDVIGIGKSTQTNFNRSKFFNHTLPLGKNVRQKCRWYLCKETKWKKWFQRIEPQFWLWWKVQHRNDNDNQKQNNFFDSILVQYNLFLNAFEHSRNANSIEQNRPKPSSIFINCSCLQQIINFSLDDDRFQWILHEISSLIVFLIHTFSWSAWMIRKDLRNFSVDLHSFGDVVMCGNGLFV